MIALLWVTLCRWRWWQCWRGSVNNGDNETTFRHAFLRCCLVWKFLYMHCCCCWILSLTQTIIVKRNIFAQFMCMLIRMIRTCNCEIVFMKLLWLRLNPFDVWISLIEIDMYVYVCIEHLWIYFFFITCRWILNVSLNSK